jgi:hypothetical protein
MVHTIYSRERREFVRRGEPPHREVLTPHAFSLTNGSVSRKRNATRSRNMKRRGAGLKKRCAEEN